MQLVAWFTLLASGDMGKWGKCFITPAQLLPYFQAVMFMEGWEGLMLQVDSRGGGGGQGTLLKRVFNRNITELASSAPVGV